MNYILGYLLERRLLEHEEPKLDALERHVHSAELRLVLRAVKAAPRGSKGSALDDILATLPSETIEECMTAIAWAQQVGPDLCSEAIAKNFPMPPDVSLEEAGMTFSATEWLWPDWIPFGYLTVLAGRPGVGKSQLGLSFAASSLARQPWPDTTRLGQSSDAVEKHSDIVVWIDTEGSQPMLYERCGKRGLPTTQIRWPLDPQQDGNPTPSWKLDNDRQWGLFSEYLEAWRPRLVVVDSLSGAVQGDENSSDMRFVLQRLAEAARDYQTAIVAIHHAKKSSGFGPVKTIEDMDRLRGSSTIAQFARSIIAIDQPGEDDAQLRVRVLKANLCKMPAPLGATIDGDNLWFTQVAPEEPRISTNKTEAAEFLFEALDHGKRLYSELEEEAKSRGVNLTAMRKASRDLKLRKEKAGQHGGYYWALPEKFHMNGNAQHYAEREE